MAEYIERETLPVKRINIGTPMFPLYKSVVYVEDIATAPAADVQLVVHGRWEVVNHYPYPDTIRCSVCGREFNGSEDWKGCPVCLARMDGE